VVKTAGWAVIRDKPSIRNMTLPTCFRRCRSRFTLGAGSNPIPYAMPAVENINGQAITLSVKHKAKNDPKQWKGFKFACPSTIRCIIISCATT